MSESRDTSSLNRKEEKTKMNSDTKEEEEEEEERINPSASRKLFADDGDDHHEVSDIVKSSGERKIAQPNEKRLIHKIQGRDETCIYVTSESEPRHSFKVDNKELQGKNTSVALSIHGHHDNKKNTPVASSIRAQRGNKRSLRKESANKKWGYSLTFTSSINSSNDKFKQKKFLFKKSLTTSDVSGKFERLVIPREYAEAHFPPLKNTREGTYPKKTRKGTYENMLQFFDDQNKKWMMNFNKSRSYEFTKGWKNFRNEHNLQAMDVIRFYELNQHYLIECEKAEAAGTNMDQSSGENCGFEEKNDSDEDDSKDGGNNEEGDGGKSCGSCKGKETIVGSNQRGDGTQSHIGSGKGKETFVSSNEQGHTGSCKGKETIVSSNEQGHTGSCKGKGKETIVSSNEQGHTGSYKGKEIIVSGNEQGHTDSCKDQSIIVEHEKPAPRRTKTIKLMGQEFEVQLSKSDTDGNDNENGNTDDQGKPKKSN